MGAAQPALTRAPDEGGLAAQYARGLLDGLGHAEPTALAACHPADAAAECGLEALTGAADGPGRICPVPIAACADGVLGALAALPGGEGLVGLCGAALLTERAAISGLVRGGRVAPGGACRLLDCADGTLAVNLAREDDWGLLPAWLERAVAPDWEALADALRTVPHAVLLERAAWLGLAVAVCAPPCQVRSPFRVLQRGPAGRCGAKTPLVVDLSALWAGPLCGHLLQRMGARVLKVESLQRPDGARNGEAAFFDLLNAGKPSVALDLASARGRDQLRGLIARA
ncbi:MAG: CoA transferase, partial [Sinimarinibacterium flocculans]|uniref:CoA transferase n=1 Tax=Sinimarinibacterium flocculans TaxID=985250 RepID=UPI003C460B8C